MTNNVTGIDYAGISQLFDTSGEQVAITTEARFSAGPPVTVAPAPAFSAIGALIGAAVGYFGGRFAGVDPLLGAGAGAAAGLLLL